MKLLPTTTARDHKGSAAGFQSRRDGGPDLEGAIIKLLPTPTAGNDSSGTRPGYDDYARPYSTLPEAVVKLLPTPLTTDAQGAGGHGDGGRDLRTTVVQDWTTEAWAEYLPAILRWARITHAQPPVPVDLNRNGKPRIAAEFSEWMMGWPTGWVTGLITDDRKAWKQGMTSRTQAMKMIGNGVVPQQAVAAIESLLEEW